MPQAATAVAQPCCVYPEMRGALSLSQSNSQVNYDGDHFCNLVFFFLNRRELNSIQKISVRYFPMKLAGGVNQVAM